jgi:hypothetical protein
MVQESFQRQSMMTTLAARISHLAPGEIDLVAPHDDRFGQQNGFWHAGAIASLADSPTAMPPLPWRRQDAMSWPWSSRSICWHQRGVILLSPEAG